MHPGDRKPRAHGQRRAFFAIRGDAARRNGQVNQLFEMLCSYDDARATTGAAGADETFGISDQLSPGHSAGAFSVCGAPCTQIQNRKTIARRSLQNSRTHSLTAPVAAGPMIPSRVGSVRIGIVLLGCHPVCWILFRGRDGTWKCWASIGIRRIRWPVFSRDCMQNTGKQHSCNGQSTLHTKITRIRLRRSAFMVPAYILNSVDCPSP
jgi:hypothetical protein